MGIRDEQAFNLSVGEIMDNKPVCVDKSITVSLLADIMSKRNVEAVVVVEEEKPIGIITEKDLLTKVLAKGRKPEELKAEDIMSQPVITISPDEDVISAMRKMLTFNIRRLVVVDKGKVVGILTISDILRITPSLIEIMQMKSMINVKEEEYVSGYCDGCGQWSDYLVLQDGQYLCENCRE